jgi:N-acetylglucosamine repressor
MNIYLEARDMLSSLEARGVHLVSGKPAEGIPNHRSMKLYNQLTVLRAIRDRGPITRVELQRQTRLSWGTITSTIKELLRTRAVREIGSVTTQVGRHPVELDMNTARNFALGLQLGTNLVRSSLVDVKGNRLHDLDAPVDPHSSAEQIVECLIRTGRRMLEDHSLKPALLAGIGVAAPGAADIATGICRYAPRHPHWKDVPLKRLIERAFGVPCVVDQTCNCFTLSEQLYGHGKGVDHFLCVLLGTGLGVGIFVDGEVYRGADSFSGQFGHTCVDVNGPLCSCGNTGCLEAFVSGSALARIAAEQIGRTPDSVLLEVRGQTAGEITAETLHLAALRGDPLSIDLLRRMGVYLGIGVANLINLFNPACIVIGGRLSRARAFFLPSFRETVEKRAWHASRRDIRFSELERGAVMGAAALVYQEMLTTGRIARRRPSP